MADSTIASFPITPDDPLADAHQDVTAWIEEGLASLSSHQYYGEIDLKSLSSGQRLFDAPAEQARRYVVAAAVQARCWDEAIAKLRAEATADRKEALLQMSPEWNGLWRRQRQTGSVVRTLMRRKLPFDRADLRCMVDWCLRSEYLIHPLAPP